jgi:hypothetical protein
MDALLKRVELLERALFAAHTEIAVIRDPVGTYSGSGAVCRCLFCEAHRARIADALPEALWPRP